jgi:hypothetical protein
MPPAGNWSGNFKKGSYNGLGTTYIEGSVALEHGVIDLHDGTILSINSSTLEVACPPPGIGAKKVQGKSRKHRPSTYYTEITVRSRAVSINTACIPSISTTSTNLKIDPCPGIATKN